MKIKDWEQIIKVWKRTQVNWRRLFTGISQGKERIENRLIKFGIKFYYKFYANFHMKSFLNYRPYICLLHWT